MAQAGQSVAITAGSGTQIATVDVGGKHHQAVVVVDAYGHVAGTAQTYYYATPPIAVGANKLFCDLFNAAGSGKVLEVTGLWLLPKADAAVTGALAVRLDLYRTSAAGTGGTAAATDSATVDVAGGNFTKTDESLPALPAQVTARAAPTGGATISRWLFPMHVFPEETSPGAHLGPGINWIPQVSPGQPVIVREGTGLLVKQGAIASVGSVSILVAFTAR